jgi:hypothetical protein
VSTRADWFTQGVASLDEDPDPFAAPVQEIGERIDLREPDAALELRYRELLYREGNLFERDVTCQIKDRADTTCTACPVSQAHDRAVPLGALCRLGRAQEQTLTELAALRCQGQ